MTPEAAVEIGETIGPVIVSRDTAEMKGGTFMRVRWLLIYRGRCVKGGKLCSMRIQRDGFHSNMNGCPIFVFGVVCYLTTIRSVNYGEEVKARY